MNNKDISNSIKEYANKNDFLGLKISILNDILLKANNIEYKKILEFIEGNNIDIFEDDNGSELNLDKNQWTLDYLVDVKIDLEDNFSKKKLDHYNDISVYRARDKEKNEARKEQTRPQKTSYKFEEKEYSSPRPKTSNKKPVYVNDNKLIYRLMLLVAIGIGAFFIIFKIIKNILD